MTMKTIQIDEATKEDLLAFAEIENIDGVDARMKPATIRAAIEPVLQGRTEITIPHVASQPAAVKAAPASLAEQDWSNPDKCYVEVTISRDQNPGGNQPVPVQVNGKKMFIERGKKQAIRYPYFYALSKAEMTMHEAPTDPAEPLGEAINVPRYNFITHTPVPDHVMR